MIITEKREEFKIDIVEIEKRICIKCLAAGRAMMVDLLMELDETIAKSRDRKEYRNKGLRKTSLKTLMGEVEYSRRVYETLDESGGKSIYICSTRHWESLSPSGLHLLMDISVPVAHSVNTDECPAYGIETMLRIHMRV
jgi:hypothetical protein